MLGTDLAAVVVFPTKPRSSRRRGQPLAGAAKRPAESSSSSSCLHSEVISTASTTHSGSKRRRFGSEPESDEPTGFQLHPGPKQSDADPVRFAPETSISECSEVIGGSAAGAATAGGDIEVSESSCFGSVVGPREITAGIPNLACFEKLSPSAAGDGDDDEEGPDEYSSAREELTLSELEDHLFTDARPYYSSSSEYSLASSSSTDGDSGAEATVSPTFILFTAFAEQFVPCTNIEAGAAAGATVSGEEASSKLLSVGRRFEDDDEEESYALFRSRERQEAAAQRDYGVAYVAMADIGRLVMEQRLLVVHWIIEYWHVMELQLETLFLGVGLVDRFLSRGYFKNARNLQLMGIACITLATRIEENQPYNCIVQQTFKVGSNVYSRSEVVAMEWQVQEVLSFQCFLTTTNRFLCFYLKAAKADAEVEDLSRYLAVLSLLDHQLLSFLPSTIAAGLVVLACLATNHESSCHLVMETHMRTKYDDLPECIKSLQWLIEYAR